MKYVKRKLGSPIPPRLLLTPQGTLKMVDGSDPAEYLKSWRRNFKLRGNVEVCITGRLAMEELEHETWMNRNARGA